jgi:Leucine-rich repeat (LRR) protein
MCLIAQDKDALSPEDIENYKKQVNNLVKYLEETLNFLGDPANVAKEKEIIINESYLKIFKDDKVQIEDDLDAKREVPLRKDVQAYLKDIQFFYRNVKFEFLIADINHFVNDDNLHFFKVSFNRNLDGITIEGDTVQNRKARFMEINLDIASTDLKIVSIYTTKLNEKEENRQWWISLPVEWKKVFGYNIFVQDSIRLSDISYFADSTVITYGDKNEEIAVADSSLNYDIELPEERQSISNTAASYDTIYFNSEIIFAELAGILKQQEIDISNNENIRYLNPLSELTELTTINCSNTLVSNLFPIRNLNDLEILNCSQTPIADLNPMFYTNTLRELNCGYTLIKDMSPIAGLINLEILECEGIKITDLDFTKDLKKLKRLNCGKTKILSVDPLKNLNLLEKLDISGTSVTDLSALDSLENLLDLNCENSAITSLESVNKIPNLQVLRISNTEISSLSELTNVENLKKIYCDNTNIAREETIQFMRDNPGTLVIFASEQLTLGWKELEEPWKKVFKSLTEISDNPTKEELHTALKIEDLDISGNTLISTLRPVRSLFSLKRLNVASMAVRDFYFIGEAIELEWLDISNNPIDSIGYLKDLKRLENLRIEHTEVTSLEPLGDLQKLNFVYADGSKVGEKAAYELRELNPSCVVVFKTTELENWWKDLPDAWKTFFTNSYSLKTSQDTEELHTIIFQDSILIKNNSEIKDLRPVSIIKGLKKLTFIGTQISSLDPLVELKNLEMLHCGQSPVNNLMPLSGLVNLNTIDIENTAVTDLSPLESNTKLKQLNCSGTQIKSLKPLSGLTKLEVVKLNNTAIKSLKPFQSLTNLKRIECYNTKISAKNVEQFKKSNPHCEVVYY